MKEHGIMFSAPMVRAVDQDRKTQTRRLASSPLAKLKPGTILWVRETFRFDVAYDDDKPRLCPSAAAVWYAADDHVRGGGVPGKLRPAIHMPRFAARFGLKLEAVRIERLQDISERDAEAEGVTWESADPPFWYVPYIHPHSLTAVGVETGDRCAERSYEKLWRMLHTAEDERWEDNPDVVVLTFSKAWVDK